MNFECWNLIIVIIFIFLQFPDNLVFVNSFSLQNRPKSIILVDPISENFSGYFKKLCKEKDVQVIDIVSPYMIGYFASQGKSLPASLHAPLAGQEKDWMVEFAWTEICGIISESEAGLEVAERIQIALNLPGNGDCPQLRNKHLMNEACKKHGLPTVKQHLASDWKSAQNFLMELHHINTNNNNMNQPRPLTYDAKINSTTSSPYPIQAFPTRYILKPVRGVASDGVYLCQSLLEARDAFQLLLGAPTYAGGRNTEILIQQFVYGQEYAIDTVSRNGEVKVLAIWKYTKRPANGAPFVYQCTELVSGSGVEEAKVVEYTLEVLQAIGLKWGPAHTEVILTRKGPLLIETNCRWHTADFVPVVRHCYGYDAINATLQALINPVVFSAIPDRPKSLRAFGRIVHLISFEAGEIKAIRHLEKLKSLKSLLKLQLDVDVGDEVQKTVDIRTECGYALLCHKDLQVEVADYKRILRIQPFMFEAEECESACWTESDSSSSSSSSNSEDGIPSSSNGNSKLSQNCPPLSASSDVRMLELLSTSLFGRVLAKARVTWRRTLTKAIVMLKKGMLLMISALAAAVVAIFYTTKFAR